MPDDASFPLSDEREEAFAREFAVNGNAAQAWMNATGGQPKYAHANGSKWARKLSARLEFLKQEAERLSKTPEFRAAADEKQRPVLLELIEKREILAEIARTGDKDSDRINAIKADNDLASHGSEAQANDALSAAATAALDRIFGPPA